jgi:hypothetical protein
MRVDWAREMFREFVGGNNNNNNNKRLYSGEIETEAVPSSI